MHLFIFPALVAVVCGAATNRCCINHKFNAVMMQTGAMKAPTTDAQIIDNSFMMDYDYDLQQIMIRGTTVDTLGHTHNLTVFTDFKLHKRYTEVEGHCQVQHTAGETMTQPCIPATFQKEGTYTLGSGSNTMTVNTFGGFSSGLKFRMTLTDDCTPVSMTQYGLLPDNSTGVIYAFLFANVQQGSLSRADPFMMPASCKSAPSTVG